MSGHMILPGGDHIEGITGWVWRLRNGVCNREPAATMAANGDAAIMGGNP